MAKKNYSKAFKFKVALELIRGDLTFLEITNKYGVPRSVAARWKKELLDNGASIFSSGKDSSSGSEISASEVEKLQI
jgi:transposase